MIYFIQAEITRRIKIGYTIDTDIIRRFKEIDSYSPDKLKLLGTIPGNYELEHEIHKKLKKYRIKGEWFEASFEVVNYIRNILNLKILLGKELPKGKQKIKKQYLTEDEIWCIRGGTM